MEAQEKLKVGIGNIEAEKLEAKPVKVVDVVITPVKFGTKENDKVGFVVKHPDREETIEISTVKHLVGNNLKETGTWFSTDKNGEIQKGSALADVLGFYEAGTLEDMKGQEVQTVIDTKGYLAIKAY